MERKPKSNLKIAIIHPDLGIGGAERLIVDAAVQLSSHGHQVHVFTAHHDNNRCFEETLEEGQSGLWGVLVGLKVAQKSFLQANINLITQCGLIPVNEQIQVVHPMEIRNLDSIKSVIFSGSNMMAIYHTGTFPVIVYGSFLPRHIFYHLHAVCAYLRCIFVALCVLFMWPSFDIILVDQVSVVVPLFKLKRSTKVVFYCHFPDMLLAQHTTFLRRLYRKPIDFIEEATTGMADLILVNSRFTASTFASTFKYLHARGIQPAVLYPAVNVDQFREPKSYKLNFLSINRFERKKNIDLAVSAFAMLRDLKEHQLQHVFKNATLTIAGGYDKRLRENVEYLEELKSLAEREGISHQVNFITSCTTTDRNELLSQCLCVVYTPKDEHFGIVPLEAMAAHKPVLACNSGGPLETIKDAVTGFLCDPSPPDFCTAMAKFIRDPQMAERMGKEAREHVANSFSTKVFGQRLNHYLSSVAGSKED